VTSPATVWVKTGSHRAREQLLRAVDLAGFEKPKPWFRRSPHPAQLRTSNEYWEIPAEVDVSRIKGAAVMAKPVPEAERFRPFWS
jgi:hypothetical protein